MSIQMRVRRAAFLTATLILGVILTTGCKSDADRPPVIRFMTDSVGRQLEITREMAREFEEQHGVTVEFRIGPESATERLSQYLRSFAASSPDLDVYQIDVIWPGVLAEHLIDLSDVVDEDDFFAPMIENNTVEGRLVAVPFYADAGLLYYRTDLLEKHGYEAPPQTWDELEEMALAIQEAERAEGNRSFHGFVFQGSAYEGLTCNALEWQAAEGGGTILTPEGQVELNTEGARRAFERAARWLGTITPRGVTTYQEEEARTVFQSGNAAFMRNWPYAYQLGQAEDSPIRGRFAVTQLPAGEGGRASTLGGWSLAVSEYSRRPELAKEFVAFLSTREAQRQRAVRGGYFATRPDVYGDPEITAEIPWYDEMRPVFENAVPRPSTVSKRLYNEISGIYFQAVHRIISGTGEDVEERLEEAQARVERIFRR